MSSAEQRYTWRDSIIDAVSSYSVDYNPRRHFYSFKGIRIVENFEYFFRDGGITGGFLGGKNSAYPWKSSSLDWVREFTGSNFSGEHSDFCFVVMDRWLSTRKNRLPGYDDKGTNRQPEGREIVSWNHVRKIFMAPDFFEQVKRIYDLQDARLLPNRISWEDFSAKVALVSDEYDYLRKFARFLITRRRNHSKPHVSS